MIRLRSLSAVFLVTSLMVSGCQTVPSTDNDAMILTQGLNIIDKNHATMRAGTDTYVLDSYIKPFEQPYYILVRKQSGKPFNKQSAEIVATQYIQPRGCTEPLVRRADLDKQNAKSTMYLIGVAC